MAAQTVVIDVVANFKNKTSAGMNSAKQSADRFADSVRKAKRETDRLGGTNARPKVTVVDRATSTLTKVTNGLRTIGGKTVRAGVKIVDYATRPLRAIKNSLFSIKGLIAAIGTGWAATQLLGKPIGIADAYSSAKIGFSNLLGDSGGQRMMNDLDEFAKKTPFNTSGVIDNAQKMMAMGWDAKDIIKDMETIGNAAAATGKMDQGLESIVRALSQIKTKGKLSTEELNQLSEAGIAAKAMLAEQLGYGTGDKGIAAMTKDLEKGLIGSEVAIQALLQGMKKFDGTMERTANETVSGLKAQLADTFEINVLRKWGQGLQDGARRGLGSILELLDASEDSLSKFGDTVYEIGQDLSNWAADKLESTIDKIMEVTSSDAFKNADGFGKVKILWDEVIAKPFGEWWDSTGQTWFEKKANSAAKSIASGIVKIGGETLKLGFSALFNTGPIGKAIAAGIALNVASGFFTGITKAQTLWSGTGEVLGTGGTTLAGMGLKGILGSTGNAMVGGSGILGSLASLGYSATGFKPTAGMYFGSTAGAMSGGKAALLGGVTAAGIAGGVAGGINALNDLTKTLKADSKNDQKLYGTRSGVKAGMVGTGALIGSFFGPMGTAIGAGVGGLATFLAGNKLADSISGVSKSTKEMNAEFEELAKKDMKKRFGDMELSAEQLSQRVSDVFGAETINRVNKFNSSMSELDSVYKSIANYRDSVGYTHERIMGKEELSEADISSYQEDLVNYVNSTANLIKSSKTAGQSAFQLLWGDDTKGAQKVTKSMNKTYTKLEKELSKKSSKLNDVIAKAFEDGKITIKEEKKINELVEQIESIQNKVEERLRKKDQKKAEIGMDLLGDKYKDTNLTAESYKQLLSELDSQSETTLKAYDDARVEARAELELKYDGKKKDAEYHRILNEIEEKWRNGKAITVKQKIDVSLEVLKTNYEKEFKEIEKALENGLSDKQVKSAKNSTIAKGPIDANKGLKWDKSSKMEFESLQQEFLENAKVDGKVQKQMKEMYEALKPQEEDLNELKKSYEEAGKKVPQWIEDSLADIDNIKLMSGDMNSFYKLIGEQIAKDDPAYAEALQNAKEKGEKVPQALIDGIEKGLEGKEVKTTVKTEAEIKAETKTEKAEAKIKAETRGACGKDQNVNAKAKVHVDSETSGKEAAANKSHGETKGMVVNAYGRKIDVVGKTHVSNITLSGAKEAISSAWEKFKGWVKSKFSVSINTSASVKPAVNYDNNKGGVKRKVANGGFFDRATKVLIGEAGPEFAIPVSPNRRQRGKALWERAGRALGLLNSEYEYAAADGGLFGRGASRLGDMMGGVSSGGNTEGTQNVTASSPIEVNVGGITIQIQGGGNGVQQDIQNNADAIAEQLADMLRQAFQNMPIASPG